MSTARYFHGSLEDAYKRANDIFFLCKDRGCDECHANGKPCDSRSCHHTKDIAHAKHRLGLESGEGFTWELVQWIDKSTDNKNIALFETDYIQYKEDCDDEF